jgi:hypothetical protein
MAGQNGFADDGGHRRTTADVPSMCHDTLADVTERYPSSTRVAAAAMTRTPGARDT